MEDNARTRLSNVWEAEGSSLAEEIRFHRRMYIWAVGAPTAVLMVAVAAGVIAGAINGNNGTALGSPPVAASTSSSSVTDVAVMALVAMLGILIAGNYLFATLRIEKQAETLAAAVASEVVAKETREIILEIEEAVEKAEAAKKIIAAGRDESIQKRIQSLEKRKKRMDDLEKLQDQVQDLMRRG